MSFVTNVTNLATRVGTEFKTVYGRQGSLTALTTTAKADLVSAINEVNAKPIPAPPPAASDTVAGVVELATTTETTTGTDSVRAVTPAGVKAAMDAVRSSILGAGVPAALDTLDELAAALGDDANFATSVTNQLANKQPIDATLTNFAGQTFTANTFAYATAADTFAVAPITAFARSILDDADAGTVRATLSVYSQADIGDVTTNFVTAFEAALV